ncbi:MAG TPA: glycosyltransferase [Cyclobacteriaceae bacterium]
MGKILFLSYDGLSDPLGQSQILPYLSGLSALGHSITIISFEKQIPFRNLSNRIFDYSQKNELNWTPLFYHKNPPVLSTLYDLFILYRIVKKLHRENNFSIIHCRSYLTALIGLAMKRKFKTRFIFDMRGFWADERVEGDIWNLKNPVYNIIYRFFKKKEKEFLQTADYIISLTKNAKNEIQSWGILSPITVIPTCVDLSLFDPSKIDETEKDKLRRSLGIEKDDFVLLYLGSWGTWYLTDEMMKFYEALKERLPTAKFLIISPDHINTKGHRFQKDFIIKSVSRLNVPLHISIASAALFFIKTSFSKKASSATKMGEIMAMNIPMITNGGWGDVDEYSNERTFILQDFNKDSVRTLITKLIQTGASPQKSFTYQIQALSLDTGIANYDQVYEQLLSL